MSTPESTSPSLFEHIFGRPMPEGDPKAVCKEAFDSLGAQLQGINKAREPVKNGVQTLLHDLAAQGFRGYVLGNFGLGLPPEPIPPYSPSALAMFSSAVEILWGFRLMSPFPEGFSYLPFDNLLPGEEVVLAKDANSVVRLLEEAGKSGVLLFCDTDAPSCLLSVGVGLRPRQTHYVAYANAAFENLMESHIFKPIPPGKAWLVPIPLVLPWQPLL